jgi:energy-coupling factor transport system permease protein
MRLIEYKERNSIIHKLDARAKLLLCFILIYFAFLFTHPLFLLALFLFSLLLGYLARIHKEIVLRVIILSPLLIFSFILWSIFYHSSLFTTSSRTETLLTIGPFTIDKISFMYGLAMPLRIAIVVISPIIFLMTTRLSEIIYGLNKMGVPYILAFTFGLSIKLVSSISDQFLTIKQAQASRGLETEKGGLIKRIKSHIPIIIPLTIRGIEISDQLGMALSIKGFNPSNRRTFYKRFKMKSIDYAIVVFCLVLSVLFTIMRLQGFGVIT